MRKNIKTITLLAAIPIFLMAGSANATIDIPLSVTDYSGTDRNSEPVTTGVPLPESANILTIRQLQLKDDRGVNVPAQFVVLARWRGIPTDITKPIKWVLLDFQATVLANRTGTYHLTDGGIGNASSTKMAIIEDSSKIAVSTGKARFQISKKYFNFFDYVWIDKNNDGLINDGIITQPYSGGLVLIDKGGKQFTTLLEAPEEIAIEEQGPLRSVIKIRGVLKAQDGAYFAPSLHYPSSWPNFDQPYRNSFVYYNCRIHFYNDKDYVKVFFTLENNGANGRTHPESNFAPVQVVYFDSVHLILKLSKFSRAAVSSEGTNTLLSATDNFTLYQDWKENLADSNKDTLEPIFSNGIFYNTNKNGQQLSTGKTNPGWIDLNDNSQGVGLAIRHFWQNFPKKITVTCSEIKIGLWPGEGYYPYCQKSDFPGPQDEIYCARGGRDGQAYLFDAGRHKTYEILLTFYSGGQQSRTKKLSISLSNPLMALASSGWYVQTKALGMIAPYGLSSSDAKLNEAMQRFEKLQSAMVYDADSQNGLTINNIKTKSPPHWEFVRQNRFFNWMNFGDLLWSSNMPSSLHYDWPYSMFLHYIRTGKRNFFDSGVEMIKHRFDIDQYHGDRTDRNNSHKYRNYMQFYESEGHADPTIAAHDPSAVGLPTHTWINGLILYYVLTGDRKAWEAAEEVGKGMMNHFGPGGLFDAHSVACTNEEIRHWSWSILNLVNLYRTNGDPTYLSVAENMAKNWLLHRESLVGGGHWGCDQSSLDCTNQLRPFKCQPVGCDACSNAQWNTMYAYVIEPLINVHYETEDRQLKDLLVRMADFVKNKLLFGGDFDATGKYRGLQSAYLWVAEDPDCKVRGCRGEVLKDIFWADLFAYTYSLTNNLEYLDWARRNFKDAMFYYASSSGYQNRDARSRISYIDGMFPNSNTKVHGLIGRSNQIYLYIEMGKSR
jgi:hypothetical protein